MEKEELVEQWDKKKIIVAVILFFFFAGSVYAGRGYFVDKNTPAPQQKISVKSSESVAGVKTQATKDEKESSETEDQASPFSFTPSTIRSDVQQKIDILKEQVTSLKVEDVASASPQIQKVINDLKALEQYPKNQAKQMCETICKSL